MKNYKIIKGFSNYTISKDGKVWSKYRKRYLKLQKMPDGYLRICLINDKKEKKGMLVHRLVAKTYLVNNDLQNQIEVDHINNIKSDNRVENLQWVTPSKNSQLAYDTGRKIPPRGELNGKSILNDKIVNLFRLLYKEFDWSVIKISQFFNINKNTLKGILYNKTWKHVV